MLNFRNLDKAIAISRAFSPSVRAKPAIEFKVGDLTVWNFGGTAEMVGVAKETAKMITLILKDDESGTYERRFLKTRLIGFKAAPVKPVAQPVQLALELKVNAMTSGELLEVLKCLVNQHGEAQTKIYDLALDAIEKKVTDEKFIEICEMLDNKLINC